MEVRFNPEGIEGGISSFVVWESISAERGIRNMFCAGECEILYKIDITPEGIRAYFTGTRRDDDVLQTTSGQSTNSEVEG